MSKYLFYLLFYLPVFCFSQSSNTLFDLVPTEQTKITFQNTIKDTKESNILLYSNFYGGAGLGIGDFNKDGLADIFFAGNLVADEIYFNEGNLKFREVSEQTGIKDNGGWSSGVLVGDVNNDGWLDIYVCRELYDDQPALRRNLLYINQGKTFDMGNGLKGVRFEEQAAKYGVDNAERTRHATFLDYNKDGFLDLFLLNQPPNPGNYSQFAGTNLKKKEWAPRLFRNNGNNTFSDVSKEAGVLRPGYGNSLVAADYNKDGWPDIYIANDYEAPDVLYLNNGNGTFKDVILEQMKHISYFAMGVDAADINNDSWLDIMTLDMVAEDNYRQKANMGGMYPEVFWRIVKEGGHHQYMFNALHLNNGNGTFSDIAQMAGVSSTDWSWANLIADFDNDGWKDIFVTNGLLRDIRNTDADKKFSKYVQQTIDDFLRNNPNVGDVDIFDILDLEEALDIMPSVPLKNYAFKNNGDLTFEKVTDEWGFEEETFSNGAAYADLDNDGDLDLIINNINAEAAVYENKTNELSSNNFLRIEFTDAAKNQSLLGTKLYVNCAEQEQFFELNNVRGMYSTSESVIHVGIGTAELVDEIRVEWPNGETSLYSNISTNQSIQIDIKDRENAKTVTQENLTLLALSKSNLGLDFIHYENQFNDFGKQVLLPHKMSQFGPALAVADVNNDGLEDVFVGAAAGHSGQLYLQNKSNEFDAQKVEAFMADIVHEDVDALFADIDQDGDQDLYVVSGGNFKPQQNKIYQDRLYLNDGKGMFERSEEKLPKFRDSGACVRAADYDNDGDLDLFIGGRHVPWSYPAPAISRLLRNDSGQFTDVTKTAAADFINLGLATDAIWTDFDRDGDSDLIVVGEWMPITFFENKNNNFVKKENLLENTEGWWYSIEKADIDGDGDDDYFVGNLGLNYKYKASEQAPFEVHYDDFDENNR